MIDFIRYVPLCQWCSMMRETFDLYTPAEHLSFDKGTCPYKASVKFRVYNPIKPNKFGIKLYQVCEAKSGNCIGFGIYNADPLRCIFIYCDTLDVTPDCTHTTKLVIKLSFCGQLMNCYKYSEITIFATPNCSRLDLLNNYACGTVRINRKMCPKHSVN